MRSVARRAVAQSFGDAAVSRLVGPALAVRAGVGTAFNPVANAKAHSLRAAVMLRP